jgi:hypothetical protein
MDTLGEMIWYRIVIKKSGGFLVSNPSPLPHLNSLDLYSWGIITQNVYGSNAHTTKNSYT